MYQYYKRDNMSTSSYDCTIHTSNDIGSMSITGCDKETRVPNDTRRMSTTRKQQGNTQKEYYVLSNWKNAKVVFLEQKLWITYLCTFNASCWCRLIDFCKWKITKRQNKGNICEINFCNEHCVLYTCSTLVCQLFVSDCLSPCLANRCMNGVWRFCQL